MWGTVDDERLYAMTQLISVNSWTEVREVRLLQRPHNQAITGSLSLSGIKVFLKCTGHKPSAQPDVEDADGIFRGMGQRSVLIPYRFC